MFVRLRILFVVAAMPAAMSLLGTPAAFAGCATTPTAPSCRPSAPPTPKITMPPTPAPAPQPTPPPAAGAATPKPATKKPATSTHRPSETAATAIETPVPTTPVELIEPSLTPEIVVTTPIPEATEQPLAARASKSSSPAGWAFLVVGLLIGGIIGRASWGLRRRKKQQIFG